jgi:hypothetical protein
MLDLFQQKVAPTYFIYYYIFRKCALLEAQRICNYRLRLGEDEQWFYISQICRNRVIICIKILL